MGGAERALGRVEMDVAGEETEDEKERGTETEGGEEEEETEEEAGGTGEGVKDGAEGEREADKTGGRFVSDTHFWSGR